MRGKLIYLATLGLVASLFVPGSAEAADPTLAAYWKFDETSGTTALDSSGNGNNGTLVGDPKWVAGKFGGALEFNGNDYVNCGNGASLQIRNQITITFWFKVRAFSNVWETFLAKGDNSYRASRSGVIGNATHMGASGTSVGGGNGWFDGAVVITDNRWHHWAGVYDGAAGRIYIDGVLDTTRAGTGRINQSGYNFYIGENAQTTGRFLHGLMDEVRLYSRALTNNEIKDVMAGAGTEYPYASSPNPADGALHEYTWVTLGWVPGDHAVSHDVYFGDNRADVEGGTGGTFCGNQVETSFTVGLPGCPYPDGLVPGTTYYWRIDEVNDNELNSPWKGNVWSFSIPSHAQEGVNELTNGGFEEGPSMPLNTWAPGTWNVYGSHTVQVVSELRGAAVPEPPIEGRYCLHVTVPAAGANFWDVGLQHLGHTFKKGKKYTLSAFLKCKRGTLRVNLKPELGEYPWTGYGEGQVTMTDKWAEYSTTTPVFAADVTPGTLTFQIAFAAGDFWVDGVRWYEGDYVPPGSPLFGIPTNLGSTVNSAYWEASPSISADALALFFDSDRPAGSGERDLYVTTRATKNDDWGRPVNLGQVVNTRFYDGQPGISADGRALYFSSDRPGGFGNQDLWLTTRPTTSDQWATPVNLGSTVNGPAHDTEPSISADGLTLFFDSDRPGGYGSWDIWMATRASTDDRWRTPVPLPPPVNGAFSDAEPSISADGRTLYFCSNRPGGYGTFDLWVATRETTDDKWAIPVNLGPIVNTTYHDWGPSISADGSTLYFTAEHVRTLRLNDYDLWQVSLEVPGLTVPGTYSKTR